MGTILCSVKQSDFFQQMEFHKATKVNLINLSKNNKGYISEYSHILSRDDEIFIIFRAYQETVKWIS